jgi:deoxyribodipyrimidine photo-lyase
MTTAIWWVRRDLRLADNQALASALAHAETVIPTFVLDPVLLNSPYAGPKRVAFLFGGLRQLDADLRARGSRLVVRRGEPLAELRALLEDSGATHIFAEEDHSPYARQRDARVAEALPLHLTGSVTVHPPGAVRKADGEPYIVFTPFSRTWKALPLPSESDVLVAPEALPSVPDLPGLPLPDSPALPSGASSTPEVLFSPGEEEAQRRLASFVEGEDPPIHRYAQSRNRLDLPGTSHLSPYLRFGMVSARQAVVSARAAAEAGSNAQGRRGAETWLNEVIWREFYVHILHHFPHVRGSSFRAEYDQIAWENDAGAFAAWCEGRTGYPVVDAAMRQLVSTGWMHNRARMIVASFLVKDLLIDWRWGERFFMQHLVDGDPAANNGGWQWTAGTGTDAAPYFRIFNPILQGKKHDPDGAFVRHWLPELAPVPDRTLHAPWEMSDEVQREAGCIIGQDYPAPVIDHAWARERTLVAYARAREAAT